MTEHIDNLFARQIDLLLKRVSDLEDKVDRLPCFHNGYPIDDGYEYDHEEQCEIPVSRCRNCGGIV
jgi:hypothetical protein|tara:strand:+ start:330 stop:527 length:198 start_codon:yes stop_codon:yes gene_type:complete